MPDEKVAEGNDSTNDASGNDKGFDQDAFFKRFGEEFKGFQQQNTQGQNAGVQGNQSGAASNDQVLSAIQALPEQFANVIKEMNPGTAGDNEGDKKEGEGNDGKEQEQTPGKPKSFVEWFFGKGQA